MKRIDRRSDDIHPLHLHRHSFELVRVGGKAKAGIMKDVAMLGGFQGFMALFKYA